MKKVILFDGNNYMYRAYHVIASRGDDAQNLLYQVPTMIQKTIRNTGINNAIVVFDPQTPNWRHELYPEYKANRPPMPEELRKLLSPLRKVVRAMGLPVVRHAGMEADDLLGTLAAKVDAKKVFIATGDKDMAQLINSRIKLIDRDNNVVDKAGVVEKFGISPRQLIDYLAACGDASDNIPGVQGVGPKTVQAILEAHSSIKKAMRAGIADLDIRGAKSVAQKFETQASAFELSRKLVTIKTDLDIECPKPGKLKTDLKKMERLQAKYVTE